MTDRNHPARPDDHHADHDVELVAEYAAGILDDVVDERRVAEWVAFCAACQVEMETQNAVASLLARSPAGGLTDDERRRIASGVASAIDQAEAPVIDLAARRQRRWMATASVAAVSLAAFIGLGTLLGGELDSDSADVVPDTESLAMPEAAVQARDLSDPDAAKLDEDQAGSDEAAEEESASLDASGVADGAASDNVSDPAAVERYGDGTAIREDLPDDQTLASLAGYLDERLATVAERPTLEPIESGAFSDRESPAPPCFTDDVLDVYLIVETTLEGSPVVAFIRGPDATGLEAVVLDADACEEIPLPE